jgi:hypothetical protein
MNANNTLNTLNTTDLFRARNDLALAQVDVLPGVLARIRRAQALIERASEEVLLATEQDVWGKAPDATATRAMVAWAQDVAAQVQRPSPLSRISALAADAAGILATGEQAHIDLLRAFRANDLGAAKEAGVYIARGAREALNFARVANLLANSPNLDEECGGEMEAEAAVWLAYATAGHALRLAEVLRNSREDWAERAPEVRRNLRGLGD